MTNEQPGATTGYVDVPGGRLYYEVAGQGQPILFNHADVSDHSMWDEQVAAFAPNYRVITYDKRGFGKTTSEDGAYSPREDIVALLAHLGVARSFVVGLSNGGARAPRRRVGAPASRRDGQRWSIPRWWMGWWSWRAG